MWAACVPISDEAWLCLSQAHSIASDLASRLAGQRQYLCSCGLELAWKPCQARLETKHDGECPDVRSRTDDANEVLLQAGSIGPEAGPDGS